MSFENRLRWLRDPVDLGCQTGTGNLVGLKGQTIRSLAGDILFFKRHGYDMLSVSPFIPHPRTPPADEPAGANVLMPRFTLVPYRRHYEIYPGKRRVEEQAGVCTACIGPMVAAIGRHVDYSRGDSLKGRETQRLETLPPGRSNESVSAT